jgi:hypothetical protein
MQVFNFMFQLIAVTFVITAGVLIGDYVGYLLYGGVKQDWIESTNTKDNENA